MIETEASGQSLSPQLERFFVPLVGAGYLSSAVAGVLSRFIDIWGMSPFHAVLQTHLMTEEQLADALAETARVDRLFHVNTAQVDERVAHLIGYRRSRTWECLPLRSDSYGVATADGIACTLDRIELVVADPTQSEQIASLRQLIGAEITLAVAERSDIVKAIDELYPLSAQLPSIQTK